MRMKKVYKIVKGKNYQMLSVGWLPKNWNYVAVEILGYSENEVLIKISRVL
jgi:hypothetical protein